MSRWISSQPLDRQQVRSRSKAWRRRPLPRSLLGPAVTTDSGASADFGIAVDLVGDQAVLSIRGEYGSLSAPLLGVIFDAVITSGCLSVALDLADTEAIDAMALEVTAGAASRLIALGGHLVIRSSAAENTRILDIGWLAELISQRLPVPTESALGPEQVTLYAKTPLGVPFPGAVDNLRGVTAIPANRDVVDGALRLVVALAKATVSGADGASVTLLRHGRLGTVAASDQIVSEMDAEQYDAGQGPCVDAAIQGRWFHAGSLEEETRWPVFTPRARSLGISAILSSPLSARGQPVGALNIYSRTASAFAAKEQWLAAVFATEASNILTEAGVQVSEEESTGRLQRALRTREIIAEAQGVIMERQKISEREAFDVLRRFSQRTGKSLHERAQDVVESTRQNQLEIDLGPPESLNE